MHKIFFIIILLSSFLFATSVKFEEEKYISALQTSVFSNGTIQFTNEFIKITYPQKDKGYTFYNDFILVTSGENTQEILYEDNIELTVLYTLFNSIYTNNNQELEEYFDINSKREFITLLPKDYLSNIIDKIEYQKNDKSLNFLKIYFLNEDWIKIEEIK